MMEDAGIVALYWARDEKAIAESAAKYGAYCLAIARQILTSREDAEESVNDTWVGAWGSMPPHKPERLSAFLGKITRRISLKRRRDRSAEKRGGGQVELALDELRECVGAATDETFEEMELARLIDAFLEALPDAEQRVFVCRYWYLDPVADIAKRFGYSESKVKSMLYRMRGKLRAKLEQEGVIV